MQRVRSFLFALVLVVILGLAGTRSASAVTFVLSASSARQIRAEGLTEATGNVSLFASSTGVIKAGSTISLDYGTAVEPTSGTVITTCTFGAGGALTKSVSGNVLTLTVATADLSCNAASFQSIVVFGVRVNANALGPGSSINVAVSAVSSDPITNPITLIAFPPLTVAVVQAAPSITITHPTSLKYEVTENFSDAFLSKSQEQLLNDNGHVQDFKIRFAFQGVPIDGVISAVDFTGSDSSLTGLVQTVLPFTSQSGAQDVNVDVTIGGTNPLGVEKLVATFTMTVPVSATVSLQGGTAPPEVPRFASPVIPVISISIDIHPGSDPNPINPRSRGKIPVAILSSPTFDAFASVDTTSLTFGHTGTETSLAFCNGSPSNINADPYPDLMCHFDTEKTGFKSGDTVGKLKGKTVSGAPIEGSDSVRIVP